MNVHALAWERGFSVVHLFLFTFKLKKYKSCFMVAAILWPVCDILHLAFFGVEIPIFLGVLCNEKENSYLPINFILIGSRVVEFDSTIFHFA